jgi:hypothetical protein
MSRAATSVPLSPASECGTRDECPKKRDTRRDGRGTLALESLHSRSPAIETGGTLGGTDWCHRCLTICPGKEDRRDNRCRG